MRQSYILRAVWPRIANFYTNLRNHRIYNHTGYDVTNYTRSEPKAKKPSKIPHQKASGVISREQFKRGSPNFTRLSGTTCPRNLQDIMTSLIASGRLQNAIKYCTKVMRKTGPACQRIKCFGQCLTQTHHMFHGHPCRPSLQPHRR